MKYEGHFILWYIILMPFAKLGFPYVTTNILSCVIMCISAWLILSKAPFKFYKKALFIFCLPMIYMFSIFSRCYCLIPLAISLMAIFYKDRKEHKYKFLLSVILLANTHIIMWGMVGIILLDYFIEIIKEWNKSDKTTNRKNIIGLVITGILLLISILPLFGCLQVNNDLGNNSNSIWVKMQSLLFKPVGVLTDIYGSLLKNYFVYISVIIAIVVLFILDFKNSKWMYLKIGIAVLYQLIIYAFIYMISYQRSATVVFIVLYFKWISAYSRTNYKSNVRNNIIKICWLYLIVLNIICAGIYIYNNEIIKKNSNAVYMGKYINENLEDDCIILNGARVEFTTSVVPYVKDSIKFYHIQGKRYFSYAIWDNENKMKLNYRDYENVINQFNKNKKIYYIYCPEKFDVGDKKSIIDEGGLLNGLENTGDLKIIYKTIDKSLYGESYILYEVIR